MAERIPFALNHIAAPALDIAGLAELARGLGIAAVEIRNDLADVPLQDASAPAAVRTAAGDIGIASVNALQRFDRWDAARAEAARHLADAAVACGAAALVLCPTNDTRDGRDAARRAMDLREALAALRPILTERGLLGLVEPLGFAECALRLKRDAVAAIDDVGAADTFSLLHDTFHHFVAGEEEMFPHRTGLVHISGVEDTSATRETMRDPHRVLVGPADRIDNVGQVAALREGGYAGLFSFEPFSAAVHALPDVAGALRASIAYIEAATARPAGLAA